MLAMARGELFPETSKQDQVSPCRQEVAVIRDGKGDTPAFEMLFLTLDFFRSSAELQQLTQVQILIYLCKIAIDSEWADRGFCNYSAIMLFNRSPKQCNS